MKDKNQGVIDNLGIVNQESTKELAEKFHVEHEVSKLLGGQEYDAIRLVNETRFFLQQHALNGIEAGKRLLILKEKEGWGNFEKIIKEDIGIDPRTARRYMGIYLKFANRTSLSDLGTTKMISALSISDEELEKLETEGTLFGIPKEALIIMSTREFQAAIKKKERLLDLSAKENSNLKDENENLKKQLADIFNPYADDLEKEVEKKCHDLFLQIKGKMLYVRNIADQIYEKPELFTESSRMQVVGFTDLILMIAAEFRDDIYKHALSELYEGMPEIERLRTTPIQGKWNPDLVPEAYNTEPEPAEPINTKGN